MESSACGRERACRRWLKAARVLLALIALGIQRAGSSEEGDLGREMLSRWHEWPGVYVRVPLKVYRLYAESLLKKQPEAPPQAPIDLVISRAEYGASLQGRDVRLAVRLDLTVMSRDDVGPVAVLSAALPWQGVEVNGKPATLREKEGWLYLDRAHETAFTDAPAGAAAGTVAVTGHADLRGEERQGAFFIAVPTVRAICSVLRAESKEAWEVRTPLAHLPIVGGEGGTSGVVAIAAPPDGAWPVLSITWRRPVPPVSRPGNVLYESYVAWHLGEGTQEVRARLAMRVIGGERDSVTLELPQGADQVRVTGPDVREVRVNGRAATVHLKGAVTGQSQLSVEFAVPWSSGGGKVRLGDFGVQGGRLEGGALVVTSGAGGVVLEEQAAGLAELGLWNVPGQAASLTAAPPVLAYTFSGGPWSAVVEPVSLAEFPVQETLIDQADYSVVLRPDGNMLHRVTFRMRNRSQQFLAVRLPAADSRIVAVRVSDRLVTPSRSGDYVLIPLEKSVETAGGSVSFPVDIAFFGSGAALNAKGRLELRLARADVPSARALCTLYVPEDFKWDRWMGAFRLSEELGEAVSGLEYGRGHVRRPVGGEGPPTGAAAVTGDARVELLAANYLRAAANAYARGDMEQAGSAARNVLKNAPGTSQAGEAQMLLGNIELMQGVTAGKSKRERVLASQLRQAEGARKEGEVSEQQELLRRARQSARTGSEAEAAEAYRAAVEMGRQLQVTADDVKQQEDVLEEAHGWLADYERQLKRNEELRAKVQDRLLGARFETVAGLGAAPGPEELDVTEAKRLGELTQYVEDVRRRGEKDMAQAAPTTVLAALLEPEKVPAPNVEAAGQLSLQHARDSAQKAPQRSVSMENILLEKSLSELDKGSATLGGFAYGQPGAPTDKQEARKAVEKLTDELLAQQRYTEAEQVLEKAKETLAGGKQRPEDADAERLSELEGRVRAARQSGALAFSVSDLVRGEGEGRELAEFLERNTGRLPGEPAGGGGVQPAAVAGDRRIRYEGGQIVLRDGGLESQVASSLENLRSNLGQKVTVNDRTIALDEWGAEQLGVSWNGVSNGRWAVVDEGMLGALLALEQRAGGTRGRLRKGQREIVAGTGVVLANGATVDVAVVMDDANGFLVNDGRVNLRHDQILLVSNDSGMVALRAGATQFWAEAPKAPEIEEVPADIAVPAVGVPVRFEKVLVAPEDDLVIECAYKYGGGGA